MNDKLNLPAFGVKIKEADGQPFLWDAVRKKYILITPEEWVRQHFINYLINYHSVPRSLVRVEGGLVVNRLSKRSDLLILDRNGKSWMLVECKSPKVKLTQETLLQALNYNKTHQAPYLVLTNGLSHLIWKIVDGSASALEEMPTYPKELG